jgi:hypothetical protein
MFKCPKCKINYFINPRAKQCKSCARKGNTNAKIVDIDYQVLFNKYSIEKKSITTIAKELNCNYVTIYKRLLKYKINLRTKSESHIGKKRPEHSLLMLGTNNPNFKNWASLEPYSKEFNENLKEQIRNRDNHECQYCHKKEIEELKEFNRRLNIHHIDYNKKNCDEDNLISLCEKCHCKTNFNRNYWTNFFKNLLERIFNYV